MVSLLSVPALVLLVCLLLRSCRRYPSRYFRRRSLPIPPEAGAKLSGFPTRKPAWVRRAVLELHERTGYSHRQLAHTFNRLHSARTGISVGRTWVRETLMRHAHQALHRQQQLKHALPHNACWGFDTTVLRDGRGTSHLVLGLVDHGSRLNLALQAWPRFNRWTLLGMLFLAVGRFGKPASIKLDNHPVHHARLVKRTLRWTGIRLGFTQPASPWQNGCIERFFGTLKTSLAGIALTDASDLHRKLREFRAWYNHVRPHHHLRGRTPAEAWSGVDPYRQLLRRALWYEGGEGRWCGWWLRH